MGATGGRARAVTGLAVFAVAGCSTVLNIDSDRYVVQPVNTADGGPKVDRWACLADGSPIISNPALPVSIQLLVMSAAATSTAAGGIDGGSDLDTVSGVFLPGVTVRACQIRDTNCEDPSVMTLVTDDGGAAYFTERNDFNGFFAMERPDLVPARLYPGSLVAGETPVSFPAYDISPSDFVSLTQAVSSARPNLDLDGGAGHALVTVYDCQDHQAPDVSFTYSFASPADGGVPFYFNNSYPDPMASQTDSFGLGGMVNVPAGLLTVRAWVASDGGASMTQVGETSFQILPGEISFAWIRVRSH